MGTDEEYEVPPPGVAAKPWRPPGWKPEPETRPAGKARPRKAKPTTKRTAAVRRWGLFNRFVDTGLAGVRPVDAEVWVALFRHADADGTVCLARGRLAALAGCTEKTASAALGRLIAAGWLVRLRRGGPVGGVALFKVQRPGREVE